MVDLNAQAAAMMGLAVIVTEEQNMPLPAADTRAPLPTQPPVTGELNYG